MAESRSFTQIAIVSTVQVNVQQCTRRPVTAHRGNTVFSRIPLMSENLTLYMRKMPRGVINLHVLNDERRLQASWLWLSLITAQGE